MTTPARPTYPIQTKIIIVAVIALAGLAFFLAIRTAETGSDAVTVSGAPGEAVSSQGVQALVPASGAQVLNQQKVGIQLADGWTGELTLQPSTGAAVPLPLDELETGTQNELLYQPGPDKTLEQLPTGTTCMIAVIWSQVDGRDASERIEQWCFQVT